MALNASSNNDYIVGLYAVAAVLAGMVVLAGIFMITGSINSNVAQRTSYYGTVSYTHLLTENYFAGDKRAALVGADDAILQIFFLLYLLYHEMLLLYTLLQFLLPLDTVSYTHLPPKELLHTNSANFSLL